MEYIDLNLKNYPNSIDKSLPAGLYDLISYAILLNYAPNKYDDLDLSYDENNQTLKITTHRGVIGAKNFLYNDEWYANWLLRNAISLFSFNDVSLTFTSSEGIFKVIVRDKQDLQETIPSIFISKEPVVTTANWIPLKDFDEQIADHDLTTSGTTILVHPISLLDLQEIKDSFSFLKSYQTVVNTLNNKLLVPKPNNLSFIYLNGARQQKYEVQNQNLNSIHLIYGYDFDLHQKYLNHTENDFQSLGDIMSAVLSELNETQQRTYFPAIFNNSQSYEWLASSVQIIVTLAMNKFNPHQYLIYHEGYEYRNFWDIAKKAGKILVKVKDKAFDYLQGEGVTTLYSFVQNYMNFQYPPSKNEARNLNFEERTNLKILANFVDNFVNDYPELKETWKKLELNRLYFAVFSDYPNPYGTYWKEYKIAIIVRKNLINMADLLIAGKEIVYQTCNLNPDQFNNKWLEATINYFVNKCNDMKNELKNNKKVVQEKKPS